MQEMQIRSLGREDPLEYEMATMATSIYFILLCPHYADSRSHCRVLSCPFCHCSLTVSLPYASAYWWKGLRGSGAGTLSVPLGGPRRVGGLLRVAGRLSSKKKRKKEK